MNMQLVQKVGKKFMKKVPVIKAGSTVKVHQRIKEGSKERIQIFEGLVIAVNSGSGPDKTFTVRKMVGGIGVEKIFPLYSTNITKIQVTKSSNVRRSKLYYMRKRSGKSARLKEKHLTEKDVVMEEIEGIGQEEEVVEEVAPEVAENAASDATEAVAEEAPAKETAAPAEEPVKKEAKSEVAENAVPAEEEKKEEVPADAPKEAPKETDASEKEEEKAA